MNNPAETATATVFHTADVSQTVGGTGTFDFNEIGEETAVDITFNDWSCGSVSIQVRSYSTEPTAVDGTIPQTNVSTYRWVLTEPGCFTSADVCFDITQIPGAGIVTPANVHIYRRTTEHGPGGFSELTPVTIVGNELCVNVSEFSEFAFGSDEEPLPIQLIAFYAEITKEGIMLHWKTSSEINNAGFYVYRNDQRISNLIAGQGTTDDSHEYSFLDKNVAVNHVYRYHLSDVEENTNAETDHPAVIIIYDEDAINQSKAVPTVYALHDAYPNPFNPKTTIQFDLPSASPVNLSIYDGSGKLIKTLVDGYRGVDFHSVEWNGTDDSGQTVSSGVYFYQLDAGNAFSETKSIILLK